jgi:DNA helicase-2/ATP-dependent DNA helicase PcrA
MLLADLDDDQRRAVTTPSHLVAVIAGAGSGKTRVLTRRVAYRIVTEAAEGAHTVVLTFTREAAGELRRRLFRLGLPDRVAAGTFHSIAQQLLRQRWADQDKAPKSIVNDRSRIVGEILGRADLDLLVAEMNFATARGWSGDEYEHAARNGDRRSTIDARRVAGALDRYAQEKHRRGVLDLDDILGMTNAEIAGDPSFADAVRWRYRHVLVDEAQDLNPMQHRFVDLLRAGSDDLFIVGDPSQAIYGFNGADPSLLVDVERRFPGVEIVRLPSNHRSTPQVVQAGAHVLDRDGQPASIRSTRDDGRAVSLTGHDDEHAEATWVATQIARLDPELVRGGHVAVLARTHAALQPSRTALEAAGLSIRRSLGTAGSPIASELMAGYRQAGAHQFRAWARDLMEQLDGPDDPLRELSIAVDEYLREQRTGDGTGFRIWVETTDPFGVDVPGVDVLTFHAAKGREWHSVFVVGCESSLVPHRSAGTNASKAEEARLLYVALTRATDTLFVNWARRRSGYQRKLSPFLDGFVSEEAELQPPPRRLVNRERAPERVALDRLREWRANAARAAGILPTAICSDHVLAQIADRRPATPEDLDAVTGLGPMTSRRLFEGIARALAPLDA